MGTNFTFKFLFRLDRVLQNFITESTEKCLSEFRPKGRTKKDI